MDLSRGICILCTSSTKIIVPPQAKAITSLITDVLIDQIDTEKFEEVNDSLKVCPMCLSDICTVSKLKQNIKQEASDDCQNCALCYEGEYLMSITEWSYFDKILHNVCMEKRPSKCSVCINCIKCLELLEKIKINLLRKYPHLESASSREKKKYETEKLKKSPATAKTKKSHSKNSIRLDEESEYSSTVTTSPIKNVNDVKAALKHLKPLRYTSFKIDDFEEDVKLSKQVAFVKLSVSNLSAKELKDLNRTPKRSTKVRGSLSESDSPGDSPSTKQSFFKIKLKINPTKAKSQKVAPGKVTKPKTHKSQSISGFKKELIVKILKTDLAKMKYLEQDSQNPIEIKTPTKASRKMMPENPTSSSKKRKSVTFADVLDTDITEGASRKDNIDATPLKSLLKKSASPTPDMLNNSTNEINEKSDDENSIGSSHNTEVDYEQETSTDKGNDGEFIKNNDSIFDNLKTSSNDCTESCDIDTTSSEDTENKEQSENGEDNLESTKDEKRKSTDANQKDSDSNEKCITESDSNGEISQEEDLERSIGVSESIKNKNVTVSSGEFEDSEKQKEYAKSNISSDEKVSKLETKEEYLEGSDKSKNVDKNDVQDLDKEENENETSKNINKNSEEIEDQENEISSTVNSDISFEVVDETSSVGSDHSEQDSGNPNSSSLEEDLDNQIDGEGLTNDENCDQGDESHEKTNGNLNNEAVVCREEGNNDKDEEVEAKITDANTSAIDSNEKNQSSTGNSSDTESVSEKNGIINIPHDSSSLKTKSKKRRRSLIEKEEEDDKLKKNKDEEDFEEPETKKEKVSDVDNLNISDIEQNMKESEDTSLGDVEEPKPIGTVDSEIDDLIAKYSNPSIPNLNNDNNVSDCQNAGASGKNRGSRSEVSSRGSEEAVNRSTNVREVSLEKSTENKDDTVMSLVEGNSVVDITSTSGVTDKDDTLKGLDFENILNDVVDSSCEKAVTVSKSER